MTNKMHLIRWLAAFFLLNSGVVFGAGFRTKVITTSQFTITVPEDHFLKITNFTQEGGTDRGVVNVTLSGDGGGTTNVLSAIRIDFSTGINSQNFPEIGNQIIITGPAQAEVVPVTGATLAISYTKELNDGFKSKIITTSQLNIPVPDDRFLKIINFTQDGGTEHAVVRVPLSGNAGGVANVLTATRIDLSTGINSQNFPEVGNQVIIAGPTEVHVPPVIGATLFITYKKEANEGGGGTTSVVTVSPTPGGTPGPSVSPTSTPAISPTATPTATATFTPTPTATPRPTRAPRVP
ncbi:MAG TPA: hypothetical protein VFQ78_03835 [Candidatus Udaeobacter sp.]|jgi:hypothetical protein|nr:hypothetical protein [Candidatus Udaeobacter sp.]